MQNWSMHILLRFGYFHVHSIASHLKNRKEVQDSMMTGVPILTIVETEKKKKQIINHYVGIFRSIVGMVVMKLMHIVGR